MCNIIKFPKWRAHLSWIQMCSFTQSFKITAGYVFRFAPRTTFECVTLCNAWPLQWRYNWRHGYSNHQPNDCLLNHLFRRWSKKTSKLLVAGLCEGNSPMASNTENVSIWWRHHGCSLPLKLERLCDHRSSTPKFVTPLCPTVYR